MSVAVGQIWKRKPPRKMRLRIDRVWDAVASETDREFGHTPGDIVPLVRAQPLNGGKPWVMPVALLEEEFVATPESSKEGE